MKTMITAEMLTAYSHCPRKAYLLLCTDAKGVPHEYECILEQQKSLNRKKYIDALKHTCPNGTFLNGNDLSSGRDFIFGATLQVEPFAASYDVLTKRASPSSLGSYSYEPTMVVGTYSISKEQELALAFTGFVLGQLQQTLPAVGCIVRMDGQVNELRLEPRYNMLKSLLDPLEEWLRTAPAQSPLLLLNKHCPSCPFQTLCQQQAEKEDTLSLLDRMTPKAIQRYHKKGIFTVTQLSYLFRKRRIRKPKKKTQVLHKLELQALAIRTNKIYLQERPVLARHSVELFLDIEGIPDQHVYYLIGLLISENNECSYHPFWADTSLDEERMWHVFLQKVSQYPEAPIYHYGGYEPHALERLAARYQTTCETITPRLVNILTCIYGKVYFPVRSNGLKDIGRFIGASWTAPDASGLQSLVWRHRWQETQNVEYQHLLMTYNEEDCQALHLLTNELSTIASTADSEPTIDFADQPKQIATPVGEQIHSRFEEILKSAHGDYDKKKIRIQQEEGKDTTKEKSAGGKRDHQGEMRPTLKATEVIHVPPREICPKCSGNVPLEVSTNMAERTIIDIVFTEDGCRKTVTTYIGPKSYCRKCYHFHYPEVWSKFARVQRFGHGLQTWVIYQRMVLRLPYLIIVQAFEELFHEQIGGSTITYFFKYFAQYYAETEGLLLQRLLASPFIHADETRINIRGTEQYVWVFTDGSHVIFRLTETREATIVHELLADYQGILISDFYGGYDGLKCQQQKCLVHLIRDMNDDLWKAPFDGEFEAFILEVKNLVDDHK
ncbi:MAG TPA: TM0106 family RecB-like putative nuclease [Ktedonobacteraceae bacterium]|jgi:predicted RecB family nuclease